MARAGIYKSEVVRARDKLLAQGRYPSIDAVRQELGNTGSKATIHRYLKEIDEEEGGKTSGSKVNLSESLQDLVARLAERLRLEADERIEVLTAKHAKELALNRLTLETAQVAGASLNQTLEKTRVDLADEQERHQRTADRLRQEILDHAVATQQIADLEDRLRVAEEHRQSLEDKHVHAREALDHFRAASKEQREQEQRQHEQQVQYLQGEIKTLRSSLVESQHDAAARKQTSAGLVSDLARAERALSEAREELRPLKSAHAELTAAQQHVEQLGRQVVKLEADQVGLRTRNAELETSQTADRAEIQQLQLDLAAAKAASDAQHQLVEKIQGWMIPKPDAASQVQPQKGR